MLLLKFAGLPFIENRKGFARAPKGKLPYIDDDGTIVADSTFIRFHIKKKYSFDFDRGLTPEQKACAWAAEKMCEEHLYFALVAERWCIDDNFAQGPAQFFRAVPMPLRPAVQFMVRGRVRRTLQLQGFGRHSRSEQVALAIADINALATLLGDKPFLMGERPCGADAAIFGFVASFLAPGFATGIRDAAEKHSNLIGYRDRILRDYFDDRNLPAGWPGQTKFV
jgi:glutathione S-transferase